MDNSTVSKPDGISANKVKLKECDAGNRPKVEPARKKLFACQAAVPQVPYFPGEAQMFQLMASMLRREAKDRFTIDDILGHTFITAPAIDFEPQSSSELKDAQDAIRYKKKETMANSERS